MVLHEKYAKEPWRHIGLKVPHHGLPPPRVQFPPGTLPVHAIVLCLGGR